MCVAAVDTREWVDDRNREWALQLRQMSLVAELEVDDDEVDRALRILGLQLRLGQAGPMARRHPAFLVVALTHAGMRGWEEGTFYAKVAAQLGVTKQQAEAVTAEFPGALRRLGLPTFDGGPGMRWVTPVLLHGAVPLDHLDELLDLLAIRRRRDPSLTGDSFVEWARLSSRELETWPRALTRFLELGGDFAPDFVGRVIDLVDGQDVVLPRRSIERLREVLATGRGRITTTREARPTIALTWDGSFIVRLPPVVPRKGREVTWRLRLGENRVERVAQLPWDERRHRTAAMTVSLDRPLRTVEVERDGSFAVIPFVRKEDPLLVFDADGDFVPPTRPVAAGRVTLAWPEVGFTRPVRRGDRPITGRVRDAPYGWEGWNLLDVDLEAGEAVRLGAAQWHRVSGADRARVVSGEIVPGLLTSDGHEVTRTRPVVLLPVDADPSDWTVLVADSDGRTRQLLTPHTQRLELLSADEHGVVADLVITVRGPLGRGVSRRVVVSEGAVVTATPEHRALELSGGLQEARVRVVGATGGPQDVTLGRHDTRATIQMGAKRFLIEVPHVAYSLVSLDLPGPWSSEPVSIEPAQLLTGSLRFRGLPAGQVPRLVFASGTDRQEVPGSSARRTSTEFMLKAFTDLAARAGSGTFLLEASGGVAVPVAHLRPPLLASGITLVGDVLHAHAEVVAPLELVVYRHAAPWLPGRVLALDPEGTPLPADLIGLGDLRVQVRTVDEWLPQPADDFPRTGRDVADIPMSWAASREQQEHRAVSRALMGYSEEPGEAVTPAALARAFEVLGSTEGARRDQLMQLLSAHPTGTVQAVTLTRASTSGIAEALVESGLVAMQVEMLDRPEFVEALIGSSPLAAMLAASARVETPIGRQAMPGALLATELGEDLDLLWSGAPDNPALGRLEPEFARRPEMVNYAFNFLSPVPGRILDADTRISCVYELWQARSRLADVSKQAMAAIAVSRRVIEGHDPKLWAMVDARLSQDGVIALPALSIALALVARLAAHLGGDADRVMLDRRRQYGKLAKHAPGLVTIDLVRADAAVIGALQ